MIRVFLLLIACVLCLATLAQAAPPLDAKTRQETIDGVLRSVNTHYIFPDVAKQMETAIRERVAKHEYDAITDGRELADRLTRDLRAVCNDKHMSVMYSDDVLPPDGETILTPPPGEREMWRRILARDNFGMPKVEVLPGNIGYIECRYLAAPDLAGDTYTSLMNYVANTDALILDLRNCSGATSEDAVPLLCGYFFEQTTHLRDVFWRTTNQTRQSWSLPYVPGKRYLNKPIYVLTSGKTFSGAEELAYDLKNLKRGTIVGETTGGGANPGGSRRVTDHFAVWVPNGHVTSPITKTNWEGVGVVPDVAIPAPRALETAHLAALKQQLKDATEPPWRAAIEQAIADVEARQNRWKKVAFSLEGYPNAKAVYVSGTFNDWSPQAVPLKRVGNAWIGTAEIEPGRQPYKFIVDGEWIVDPANKETEKVGQFTNSIRIVP